MTNDRTGGHSGHSHPLSLSLTKFSTSSALHLGSDTCSHGNTINRGPTRVRKSLSLPSSPPVHKSWHLEICLAVYLFIPEQFFQVVHFVILWISFFPLPYYYSSLAQSVSLQHVQAKTLHTQVHNHIKKSLPYCHEFIPIYYKFSKYKLSH